MKKILITLVFALGLLAGSARGAFASEGLFEMRNRIGTDARCFAASVLMQDQQYRVVISCRDILYPGGTEVFSYVVWATPTDGKNAFRLGTLGLGKVEFKTKTAFTNLFVTKEPDDRPKSPTGQLIMDGSRQIISMLDGAGATNSGTGTSNKPNELMSEPTPTPTASPAAQAGGSNVFRIIAAGGIIAFLALFGIVLVVFVITRR